ncbi:hypothetical protein AU476_17035 [Cupriavidus sp. UYMSc13B]|nr:hypothetical protein AU476_17035 [Cupriavidus sp. UYMSc13B]
MAAEASPEKLQREMIFMQAYSNELQSQNLRTMEKVGVVLGQLLAAQTRAEHECPIGSGKTKPSQTMIATTTIADHMNDNQIASEPKGVVPSPADAIAAFRRGRVQTAVESIAATTQAFAAVVDDSVSGERAASASVKALVKAFVSSFRALQETQDAAKAAGVISHDTSSAIHGV